MCMNQIVQRKIEEIKRMAATQKASSGVSFVRENESLDGLSIAIRSKKDADDFMAELKAISQKSD